MKYWLLDAGHSSSNLPPDQITPGKRSPDWEKGVLYEGDFNRDIVERVKKMITYKMPFSLGLRIITPENEDIPHTERVRRINKYCTQYGSLNCRLISVHANASPEDAPIKGTGGEVFVSDNASEESKRMANIFTTAWIDAFPGEKWRTEVPFQRYKVRRFTILRRSQCPGILTENFFMDNKEDYLKLWDDAVRQKVAQAHFELIKRIV